jgi:hypothetical protein
VEDLSSTLSHCPRLRLVYLEIPEPGATEYQNLMRQDPKLTRVVRPNPPCALNARNHSRGNRGREARSLNFPITPFFREPRKRRLLPVVDHPFPIGSAHWSTGEAIHGVAPEQRSHLNEFLSTGFWAEQGCPPCRSFPARRCGRRAHRQ